MIPLGPQSGISPSVIPYLSCVSSSVWLKTTWLANKLPAPQSCYCVDQSELNQAPCLPLSEAELLLFSGMGVLFRHVMCFVLPKSVASFWKINFHTFHASQDYFMYIYYWYFLSSWPQIGILW